MFYDHYGKGSTMNPSDDGPLSNMHWPWRACDAEHKGGHRCMLLADHSGPHQCCMGMCLHWEWDSVLEHKTALHTQEE